jgi:hypothetical protein
VYGRVARIRALTKRAKAAVIAGSSGLQSRDVPLLAIASAG